MIRKRHQSSLKLFDYQIIVIEEKSTWEVRTNDVTHPYTISKLQSKCPYNCSICCPDCKVCVHEYMCTCPDAMIRTTICKHINLIARYTASTTSSHHNGTTEHSVLKNLQNPARDTTSYSPRPSQGLTGPAHFSRAIMRRTCTVACVSNNYYRSKVKWLNSCRYPHVAITCKAPRDGNDSTSFHLICGRQLTDARSPFYSSMGSGTVVRWARSSYIVIFNILQYFWSFFIFRNYLCMQR